MIKVIKGSRIKSAFKKDEHQYLAGNLKRPQVLKYVPVLDVNIGIGVHKKYGWERPHYHVESTEYQYVLAGKAKYVDLKNNKEYLVKKGDFFVIEKYTPYLLKAQKGCRILFIKSPAADDKKDISITENMKRWVKSWYEKW